MDGPAYSLAAAPVSVKMPAPMMTPMPNTVRSRALRVFFSLWSASSADAIDASTDLVRNTLMLTSELPGDGLITTERERNATACECCPRVIGRAPRTGARDYPLGTHLGASLSASRGSDQLSVSRRPGRWAAPGWGRCRGRVGGA